MRRVRDAVGGEFIRTARRPGGGAQFAEPRTAGLLWAIATWMKWVPAPLLLVLAPRARLWGLGFLAISAALSVVMLPATIVQLQALFGFGPRPIRLDYLVLLWAAIPWWWAHPRPLWWLLPGAWPRILRPWLDRVGAWLEAWRADYNLQRPHSKLGWRTPTDYARTWTRNEALEGRPSRAFDDDRIPVPAG